MNELRTSEVPGTFRPTTGTVEAWNAAYVRVEDYLRAHRIHHRLHATKIVLKILERAARRHEANPSLDPTTLAAEETEQLIDEWFAEMLDSRGQPHDRIAVDGRVALFLADATKKWPDAFLEDHDMPEELVREMRASAIAAGPDMTVSSMVPRPIDLGPISEAAGETLERFERMPLVRTLLLWLVFAGALLAIFYATR